MKAILPLAALLSLYVTLAFGETNVLLSKYCEECIRKSATSGLYPHPNRCDAFVKCDALEKRFRAFVMYCPSGLFFDEKNGNCNWEWAVKCNRDCKGRQAIKDAFTCNGYFECTNGKRNPLKKFCQNQQRFDGSQSRCVPDQNCPPPKKPLSCSPHFKPHPSDSSKFYQFTANGWIKKQCAIGTGFNMTTCTCSIILPQKPTIVCKLVDLPLVQNLVEQSHGWYIKYEHVNIENNSAKFKSNSYLIAPVVTNNDFKDQLSISLSFYLADVLQNTVAVLGNSECKIPPTFTIFVKNANTNLPVMVGKFILEHQGKNISVEITTPILKKTWVNVKLIKKGDIVEMWSNNKMVQQKIVPGFIKKQNCALTLGQSYKMGNFVGYIKNVVINKCP